MVIKPKVTVPLSDTLLPYRIENPAGRQSCLSPEQCRPDFSSFICLSQGLKEILFAMLSPLTSKANSRHLSVILDYWYSAV